MFIWAWLPVTTGVVIQPERLKLLGDWSLIFVFGFLKAFMQCLGNRSMFLKDDPYERTLTVCGCERNLSTEHDNSLIF